MLNINLASGQEIAIDNGITWLRENQNPDGSWGGTTTSTTSLMDTTSAVANALYYLGISDTVYSNAITWISEQEVISTRYLAQKIEAFTKSGADVTELISKLVSYQNSDGGWGINQGYTSDNLDTALDFRALYTADYPDITVLENAITFLINNQNNDGSWSLEAGGSGNIEITATVILALRDYQLKTGYNPTTLSSSIANGASWLDYQHNIDTSIYETALSYSALMKTTQPTILSGTLGYLLASQASNGSWDQDAYTTALVLRALKDSEIPPPAPADLTLTSADITFNPATPTTGEIVLITATIHNQGESPVTNVIVQFFNGDPDNGGTQIGSDLTIYSLPSGVTADVPIGVSFSTGVYDIYVRIDPTNTIAESDETNNKTFNTITVTEAMGTPADLTLSSADITFSPSSPTAVDPITITAIVRNIGGTLASNVVVRVYDGATQLGPDFTFSSIGTGGQGTVQLISTLTVGNHEIYVKVDPDNLISESNENNNQGSIPITVSSPPTVLADLTISSSDVTFSNPSPTESDAITITAIIQNIGGSDAIQVVVQCYDGNPQAGGTKIKEDITLPAIATGSTETANFTTSLVTGSHDIYVRIDPYNTVSELDETNNQAFNSIVVLPAPVALTDLSVSPSDINFSNPAPLQGDTITITATIHNLRLSVENVRIQFYDGNPDTGGVQIGTDQIIPLLRAGDITPVSVDWIVESTGIHNIYILVDPDNIIEESKETNNIAYENLGVSSHFSANLNVNTDKDEYTVNEDVQIGVDVTIDYLDQRFRTWTTKDDWESEGTTRTNIDTETNHGDVKITPSLLTATWSGIYDAGQVVDWGEIRWNATLPPDPALVGDWHMEEGTGTMLKDSSQYNNQGIIYGATWTDGRFGKALSFDGVDDYAKVMKSDTFSPLADGSIGLWFKPAQDITPNSGKFYFLITVAGADTVGVPGPPMIIIDSRPFWGTDSGKVMAGIWSGGPWPDEWNFIKSQQTSWNANTWYQVVFTFGSNGEKLYINGELSDTDPYTGQMSFGRFNEMYFGHDRIGIAQEFYGYMDEVRIYNRALTAEEITRHYQGIPTIAIKFRTRTADTKENLSSATWSDYYQEPCSAITSPKNRWVEVEATLESLIPSVTPTLHNLIVGYSSTEDIAVESSIQDSQRNTVYGFEPFKITDFSLGQAKHYDLIWNTESTVAGDYQVYADLTKDGETVAQDIDTFKILPELGIISSVATDKIAYTSNETVTILSMVISQSSNFTYTNLTIKESITDSSGTEVFTVEKTISNLSPNAIQGLKFYWNTGTTVPGDYTVTQEVLFEDTVVSQVSTAFQITSSIDKAVGISGKITVNPQEINAGEEVTFSYQITNIGNVDMANLTLKVLLIDPDSEQAVKTYSELIDSITIGTTHEKTFIDTISLPMKKYLVAFLGEVAGVTIPIDSNWLYVQSIPATIIIKPESFNRNTGVFTAFVRFPDGYNVSTITDVFCDGAPYERMIYNQGTDQMIIEFRRDKITELPLDTTFIVTGHFGDGMVFQGSDTILQVIE